MKRDVAMTGAIRHLKRLLTGGLKVSALYKKAELQNEAQRRRWRHDITECCSLEELLSLDAEWMPDQASVTQYPSFTPSARWPWLRPCVSCSYTLSADQSSAQTCVKSLEWFQSSSVSCWSLVHWPFLQRAEISVFSNSNLWMRSQAENSDTAI